MTQQISVKHTLGRRSANNASRVAANIQLEPIAQAATTVERGNRHRPSYREYVLTYPPGFTNPALFTPVGSQAETCNTQLSCWTHHALPTHIPDLRTMNEISADRYAATAAHVLTLGSSPDHC